MKFCSCSSGNILIINTHGVNNADFADVKAVMSEKGMTLMGTGEAKGDNRAEEAVNKALSSPLLGDMSISGATGVLYNITAAKIGIKEINTISNIINENVSGDVKINKFGTVKDDKMDAILRVTVIATGFKGEAKETKRMSDPFEGMEPFDISSKNTRDSEIRTNNFRNIPKKKEDAYFFGKRQKNVSRETAGIRDNRQAAVITDFNKSDYINSNNVPHMGSSDSFGDDNDILDTPAFLRNKVTE